MTTSVLTVTVQIARDYRHFTHLTALDVWLFVCEILVGASVLEMVLAFSSAKRRMLLVSVEPHRVKPEER